MALIYKIENLTNGKLYIGQTCLTINKRWNDHIHYGANKKEIPLYKAFNKYGIDNFKISLIEECSNELADEREIYWIAFYNTFQGDGYNATVGGKGYHNVNHEQVIREYDNLKSIIQVSEKLGHDRKTIRGILQSNNIKIIKTERRKGYTHKKHHNLDYQKISDKYLETKSLRQTGEIMNCNIATVRKAVVEITGKTPAEWYREK